MADVFINFNGNCRQAVAFYAEVFKTGKPKIMTFGDTPPDPRFPMDDETKKLVMYTSLNIGGSNVMFSDVYPGMPFIAGNNISISVGSKVIDEIKALFNKMKEGGTVTMELQETFWSKCYGSVIDKFGIPWMFSHDSGTFQL